MAGFSTRARGGVSMNFVWENVLWKILQIHFTDRSDYVPRYLEWKTVFFARLWQTRLTRQNLHAAYQDPFSIDIFNFLAGTGCGPGVRSYSGRQVPGSSPPLSASQCMQNDDIIFPQSHWRSGTIKPKEDQMTVTSIRFDFISRGNGEMGKCKTSHQSCNVGFEGC